MRCLKALSLSFFSSFVSLLMQSCALFDGLPAFPPLKPAADSLSDYEGSSEVSVSRLSSVLRSWERFGTREKALDFLRERMRAEGSLPLVLWECGGGGHGYSCLLLTTKSAVYAHDKGGPWLMNAVAVDPAEAAKVHEQARALLNYPGDASFFGSDSWSYFCTIWDGDRASAFAVYGLDIKLSSGQARANPAFARNVKPASELLQSVFSAAGMDLRGEPYRASSEGR